MAEHAGKPKVRFAGFTEDWEQRKLGEIADKVTEKNTTLRYTEALTNSAEFGIIGQRDFFDHDVAKLSSLHGYYIVKEDDFVYNPRISVTAPVGPVNRNKLGKIGVVSPLYTVLRTAQIDNEFLEWFFKSACWHSFMIFNGDSGARSDRFSIKNSTFFEMPIPCPCRMEQVRIGTFFRHLDRLITLHQRKRGRLENIKKAMLEKMFPKNGADVPEIRFAGFTEAWEQRKVGEYYDFKNGLNKGKEYFGIGTPIVNFTDVFHLRGIYEKDLKGKVSLTRAEIANFQVKMGDIFFTRTSETIDEIGFPSVMLDEPKDTVFSGFVLRGRALQDDPLTLQFKRYVFFTDAFRKEMVKKSSITTRALTSGTAIKNMEFVFPKNKKEQEFIGNFFRHLDRLITLHQRKVTLLQNIKKACLEKMFV